MPDWSLVNRSHVLAALAEHDRLGSREFLSRYRFARARVATLWHHGQEYDSNAILGYAYLQATGRAATREELSGESGARVLKGLGFDVVVDEQELERDVQRHEVRDTAVRERKTRPAAKKAVKPTRTKPAQPTVRLCPTCHVAVPASGVCDYCD
jgi:hypothetical protein